MSEPILRDPVEVRDAEVSLLGAAMSGYPDLDTLLATVEPEDFFQPFHTDVWAAIGRVHRAGNKPEPVSVRLALDATDARYDPLALINMTSVVPIVGMAPYYAERVASAAGMRLLVEAGVKVSQLATEYGDLERAREDARAAVDAACRGKSVSKARRLADMLGGALDAAEQGRGAVLSTPWPDLDRSIGGLAPGRLVVVGARPGGGKSLAGTNLALHFAHTHGHAVMLASLEMPEQEVVYRLLSAHAKVDLSALENSSVSEADWVKIADRHTELDAMPIFIEDDSSLTIQGIRARAREVQRERDDLALIVVDYLQLVEPDRSRKNGSRAEEVSAISRGLKLLARETGACVVAMAQVNREGAQDHGPRLTDLREGGVENDADVVVLLHRPNLEAAEVTVTVAKNRHGPLGVSTLLLQGQYARLMPAAWSPTKGMR